MKYTKPVVTRLPSAAWAIQSSTSNKNNPRTPDGAVTIGSNSAYEADE
jgi:hypothetical protein